MECKVTIARNRGLTFTSLIVGLLIVALLLALFARAAPKAREAANRVRCARQLKNLAMSIALYYNENKGAFPRTTYVPDAPLTAYTGSQALDPFGPGGPAANDVTAGIFLLIRTQDIPSFIFVCPSTDFSQWNFNGKYSQYVSNFPGNQNLAYSYANPYPSAQAHQSGYDLSPKTRADFVIAADMNPGGAIFPTLTPQSPPAQLRGGNSKNHGGDGQNVLYAGWHVEFRQTPFCGANEDCIYTVAGRDSASASGKTSSTILGSPTWEGDSVLLPVAEIDSGYVSASATFIRVLAAALILGAPIVFSLWLAVRNHPKPPPATAGATNLSETSTPPPRG